MSGLLKGSEYGRDSACSDVVPSPLAGTAESPSSDLAAGRKFPSIWITCATSCGIFISPFSQHCVHLDVKNQRIVSDNKAMDNKVTLLLLLLKVQEENSIIFQSCDLTPCWRLFFPSFSIFVYFAHCFYLNLFYFLIFLPLIGVRYKKTKFSNSISLRFCAEA